MRERAFNRGWAVIHDSWHCRTDDHAAITERLTPSSDARMVYRVSDQHLPFARLLQKLDMPLAAVPIGKRLYLGVRCENELQARRRTLDIFQAVTRRPRMARAMQHDLRLWRARSVGAIGQLTLWWPTIEVFRDWLN